VLVSCADLFFASLVFYVVRHSGEQQKLLVALRWKPLRRIGMVSYSLYLVHYPLLITAMRICERFHFGRRLNAVMIDVVALTLTFAVAFAMWYGFEAYALRLKDRYFPSIAEPKPARPAERTQAATAA
jgi:peptidoglycan/LPS O-acetylase OafA/YrhL